MAKVEVIDLDDDAVSTPPEWDAFKKPKATVTTADPEALERAFNRGAHLKLPPEPAPSANVTPASKAKAKPKLGQRGPVPVEEPPSAEAAAQAALEAEEFKTQMGGLFAAGLIAMTSIMLTPEMTTTSEEAEAIGQPLANILARRIDFAAKLGKDAGDVVALAAGLVFYGVRIIPIATNKVQEARSARTAPERRIIRPPQPIRPPDSDGADRVRPRQDVGLSTQAGPAGTALAALASARDIGLGSLDRSFGYAEE